MYATQHLVLDLDQIAGVEEGIARGELGIGHLLWPRIERVVPTQRGPFDVLRRLSQPKPPDCVVPIMPNVSGRSSALRSTAHSTVKRELNLSHSIHRVRFSGIKRFTQAA